MKPTPPPRQRIKPPIRRAAAPPLPKRPGGLPADWAERSIYFRKGKGRVKR